VLLTDQSFTVSAWVTLSDREQRRTIVSQDGVHMSAFRLDYSDVSDAWCFRMRHSDTPGAINTAVCEVTPELDRWTHVVGVYDAASLEIRLYVDGQLAGSKPYTRVTWQADGPLTIGRTLHTSSGGSLSFFRHHGMIDTVRAHQGAATDTQVASWYADQSAPLPDPQPPLLAGDWRMDERSGGSVLDHTFSGNDGVLSGGAAWPQPGQSYAAATGWNLMATPAR
jgi:hypothetical protein